MAPVSFLLETGDAIGDETGIFSVFPALFERVRRLVNGDSPDSLAERRLSAILLMIFRLNVFHNNSKSEFEHQMKICLHDFARFFVNLSV